MQLVFILLGAALGAAMGMLGTAALGAVVGWLTHGALEQRSRIARLEARLALLQRGMAETPAPAVAEWQPGTPAAEANAESQAEPDLAPAPAVASSVAATAADASPAVELMAPAPVAAVAAVEPVAPRPPNALQRLLFGGNTVAKAGVGILFLGLAFLARYASENLSVPIELRLSAIAAAAIALMAFGWRLRERRRDYAMLLQGGAIAVLYLTLFAAFRFYGVLAAGPAFALMALVAGLAAALAVLQDALALAVIGALGGFATPLLLSDGSGQPLALFSYLLVLDLGIALVAWFRHWRLLNALGFSLTYAIAAAWGLWAYTPAQAAMAETFLVVYFVLFIAVTLMPARLGRVAAPHERWIHAGLLFGLPTISFALQYGVVQGRAMPLAFTALAMGGFYVGLAALARRRAALAAVFEPVLAIGIVFLTLVIPLAFDAQVTAGAWALEGVGLLWAGLRQSHLRTRLGGYLLTLLAGVASAHAANVAPVAPTQIWNATLVNALLIGASALLGAWFLRSHPDRLHAAEASAEGGLIGWATLWLAGVSVFEVDHFAPGGAAMPALAGALSAVAALYSALANRLNWPRLAQPVAWHTPALATCLLLTALQGQVPAHHGGWLMWPLALAVHGLALAWAARFWTASARRMSHALGPLILAMLGALQSRALTAGWGDGGSAWTWLGWLAAPALVLAALLRALRGAAERAPWPVRDAPTAYGQLASGVLAASLLAWAMLANIGSDGSARPLPYLPLVNPLDLGIAVALFAGWRWWHSAAAEPLRGPREPLGLWAFGGAAFAWLNGMLVRAFHHHGGVAYEPAAWLASQPVQTGLALLWSTVATALMWWSARHARRAAWLVGAALLAAVVVKLMLVDLAAGGTVTRIVSFIGVGVLMLLIGYVAPMPARERTHGA